MKKCSILALSLSSFLTAQVVQINSLEELKNLISNGKTVVKFFADWCGACQHTTLAFDDVSNEATFDGIKFASVNIAEHQDIAKENNITGIPTFAYFEDGTKKDEMVGVRNIEEFRAEFRKELAKTFKIALADTDTEENVMNSIDHGRVKEKAPAKSSQNNDIFAQFTDILRRIFYFLRDLIANIFDWIKNLFGIK